MARATDPWGETVEEMMDLVAASAFFQAWTDTADATAARLRTHRYSFKFDSVFPFVVVDFGDDLTQERSAERTWDLWAKGMIEVDFYQAIDSAFLEAPGQGRDESGALVDAVFNATSVIADMRALSGCDEYPLMGNLKPQKPGFLTDPKTGASVDYSLVAFNIGVG